VAVGVNEQAGSEADCVRATAVLDCPAEAALARGGHFGPVLAVICADDDEAALALHERFDQKLSTAVFTGTPGRIGGIAHRLGSSFVTVNDCVLPTSHPGASISGIGTSGWGATRGRDGLLAMTRAVCVSRTSTWMRIPARRPDGATLRRLRQMMKFLYGGDGSVALKALGVDAAARTAGGLGGAVGHGAGAGAGATAGGECKPAMAAGQGHAQHAGT
jgi:aldehyde dehydrogenase (NAD+)